MLRSSAFKRQTHTKIASKRPATRTIKIKIPFGAPERYHTPPGIPMVYSVETTQHLVDALIDGNLALFKKLVLSSKKNKSAIDVYIYQAIEDHSRFIDKKIIANVLNDQTVFQIFAKASHFRGLSMVFSNSYDTNNTDFLDRILNDRNLYKDLQSYAIDHVFHAAVKKNDWAIIKKIIERDRLLEHLNRFDFEKALVALKCSLKDQAGITQQQKNIMLYLKDIFVAVLKNEGAKPEDL